MTDRETEYNEMLAEEARIEQSIKQMEFFDWFETVKNTPSGFLEAYERAREAGITVENFINYELNKAALNPPPVFESSLVPDDIPF